MIDRSQIGSRSEVREFEVEKGAIRAFANAIGDDNPLYHDEAYARARGFASLVAPPTFPATFRMPKPPVLESLELRRTLHGEQEFTYTRPIVAGDILRCVNVLTDIYEREGKQGGKMVFFILETRGEDLEGNLVFTSKTTIIYR